ncbi:MAG TPA: glycosyltransferase family 4 protein [Candidatus Binatia bacterium]|nr:glycosyltransferase family 4 protein [Candidatus Binatia bacterium]
MRIALLSTAAVSVPPSGYGGTERVLAVLADGLVAAGHDVTLFATGDSTTRAKLRALYPGPVWPIDQLSELNHAAWAVAEIGRTGGFDVVHANQPHALPLLRFLRVPCVYTMHHDRQEALARFYAQFPDVHYVAISERQRAMHASPAQPHLHLVRHGLDPAAWPFVAAPDGYVCFLGRFAPMKGPHLAVDAARRAGVPIRLGGCPHPGEGEEFHAREIVPRLAQPGVEWLGEVRGEAQQRLLGRARATLFPIAWEEPFGLVMIESMVCGTPVIAFPRGAAREVVEEGTTGLLVEDVDAMAAAIARADTIDRARCRARAVERFGAERMVRDYLRVYAAAIAETRVARELVATLVAEPVAGSG